MAEELVAQAACRLLAAVAAAYALFVGRRAVWGLRTRLPDSWSALAASATLVGLAAMLWHWGPNLLPTPFSPALVALAVAAPATVAAFTLLRIQDSLDRWGARLPGWMRWRMPAMRHEESRKWPHLLLGIMVGVVPAFGHFAIAALDFLPFPAGARENVAALAEGPWHVSGMTAAAWVLLMLTFAILPIEIARLASPTRPYPLRRVIEPRLRERERGLYGAHLYIVLGASLAVLWLGGSKVTPWAAAATTAALAITVFADAASALVGVRWGKSKWRHAPQKSHVGTLGGTAVAFLIAWPLVGLPAAGAAALLFAILDAMAPVPVPISDNLLNPIGLAALFALFP